MARSDDNLMAIIALGIVGYFVYTHFFGAGAAAVTGSPSPTSSVSQLCKFPDGSYLTVPVGNACPYDANHGGQSTLCPIGTYPTNFVGPLEPSSSYC